MATPEGDLAVLELGFRVCVGMGGSFSGFCMIVVRVRLEGGGGEGVLSDEASRLLVGCWLLDLGSIFSRT